jgi:hypothetical protein
MTISRLQDLEGYFNIGKYGWQTEEKKPSVSRHGLLGSMNKHAHE